MSRAENKLEQVLQIEPAHEIHFSGPFTEVSVAKLSLKNPSDKRVYFKVKTTAPRMYCVRPNCAMIEPGETILVSVMLQPEKNDPSSSERWRHKFMVQSLYHPGEPFESIEALWKDANPDLIMASRLRCIFDQPVAQKNLTTVEEKAEERKVETADAKDEADNVKNSAADDDQLGNISDLSAENNRLRKQLTELTQEYEVTKAEQVRLRKVAVNSTVQSTPTNAPVSTVQRTSPLLSLTVWILIIFAMALGVLIGKKYL